MTQLSLFSFMEEPPKPEPKNVELTAGDVFSYQGIEHVIIEVHPRANEIKVKSLAHNGVLGPVQITRFEKETGFKILRKPITRGQFVNN